MGQESVSASADADVITVADVTTGELSLAEDSGAELRCTGETLTFDGGDVSIPHRDVVNTRVDADRSAAGFAMLGNVFGVAAVLLGYVFGHVLLNGGELISISGAGSGLSAVLALYGCFWFRKLEVGERVVLQVDRADGSRVLFWTPDDEGLFDEIQSRIDASHR